MKLTYQADDESQYLVLIIPSAPLGEGKQDLIACAYHILDGGDTNKVGHGRA